MAAGLLRPRAGLAGRQAGGLRGYSNVYPAQPSMWLQRKVPALREPRYSGLTQSNTRTGYLRLDSGEQKLNPNREFWGLEGKGSTTPSILRMAPESDLTAGWHLARSSSVSLGLRHLEHSSVPRKAAWALRALTVEAPVARALVRPARVTSSPGCRAMALLSPGGEQRACVVHSQGAAAFPGSSDSQASRL